MSYNRVYYIQTEFTIPDQGLLVNIQNPVSLVVSDSETNAIKTMSNLIGRLNCSIHLPTQPHSCCMHIPNLAYYGHGMDFYSFIQNPRNFENYRKLLEIYFPCAPRRRLQIFDERGELTVTGGRPSPIIENPKDASSSLNYPVIVVEASQVDNIHRGIAFIDETSTTYQKGTILVAQTQLDTNGVEIYFQTMITPLGEILTRQYRNNVWQEWQAANGSYTEAPLDNNKYLRSGATWVPYILDAYPSKGSNNAVASYGICKYVEDNLTRVYKYNGTYSDAGYFQSMTANSDNTKNGYVYNYSGPQVVITQPQSDIPYEVNWELLYTTEEDTAFVVDQNFAFLFPENIEVTLIGHSGSTATVKVLSQSYDSQTTAEIHVEILKGRIVGTGSQIKVALPLHLDPGDNIAVTYIGNHIYLDEFSTSVDVSKFLEKSIQGNGRNFLSDLNTYSEIESSDNISYLFSNTPKRAGQAISSLMPYFNSRIINNKVYRVDKLPFTEDGLEDYDNCTAYLIFQNDFKTMYTLLQTDNGIYYAFAPLIIYDYTLGIVDSLDHFTNWQKVVTSTTLATAISKLPSYSYLDSIAGSVSIQPAVSGVTSIMRMIIDYPIEYTHYSLIVENKTIQENIPKGNSVTSATAVFESSNIIVDLYNNNTKMLSLKVRKTLKSSSLQLGKLIILA